MRDVAVRLQILALIIAVCGPVSACKGRGESRLTETIDRGELRCEIGVIGGGPAGTYAAYRLSVTLHRKGVCLFEKETALGGRFRDEEFITTEGIPVRVGFGARRVNATHTISIKLAQELGVELQTPPPRAQLINIGDRYGFSPDDFTADLPPITGFERDADPETTIEDELYNFLMRPENRAKVTPAMTWREYIELIAGAPVYKFLRAVSRFRGDFDYDLSARNYLEFLEEELKITSVNLYPVGGMAAFVRAMAERAEASEDAPVTIKTGEPLTAFEALPAGGYMLHTPHFNLPVRQLIITAPPAGFDHVRGELADQIRARPEYKALVPIRIVIINQQWDRAWWLEGRRDPDGRLAWRGWTTEHCIQHTEIPQEPYLVPAHVTRSVYSEDPRCVAYWEGLYGRGDIEAVVAEVRNGLAKLFGINVPAPKRTTMHVWPGGWYYTRPGTTVTNAEIARWSIEPIPGRRDLMLAGEAYWGNRPGWSTGAYLSVDALLAARFAD